MYRSNILFTTTVNTAIEFLASRRFHWGLLLAFLACYPLSQFMPPAWAWENGLIENLQIAVLTVAACWPGSPGAACVPVLPPSWPAAQCRCGCCLPGAS
jgi:hypothetical protein